MVRYFCIIDKRFIRPDLMPGKLCRGLSVRADGASLKPFFQCGHDIGSEIAGIRARVGQDLMILVQALHDVQRLFGRISVPLVRFPLQRGQVVKRRGEGFFCFPPDLRDMQFFPAYRFLDSLHPGFIKGPV